MLQTDVIDLIVKLALREDVGRKDITTSGIIPPAKHVHAEIEAKESGVLYGVEIAERVFRHVDANLRFLPVAIDGEIMEKGREIAYIDGSAASVLIAERTALNFLGHLSGIATHTSRFVDKVRGTGVKILDTRKTTPNMRLLEKYAVAAGGGAHHRMGLYDQVLIKDNHLLILKDMAIPAILASSRESVQKNTVIGIEVKNLKELQEAFKGKPDYILLDNMKPEMIRKAVEVRRKAELKIPFEISGGVNLDNVREYAETGVERISIGSLTHSAPWLDISLDIVG